MNICFAFLIIFIFLLSYPSEAKIVRELYVATNGNDAWPGTKAKPLATLEGARNELRRINKSSGLPKGEFTVWIRGGMYELSRTFELSSEDSGCVDSPITYRGFPKEEVHISGGKAITGFHPVMDPVVLQRMD